MFAVALGFAPGCATPQRGASIPEGTTALVAPDAATSISEDFLIGPNDVLEVRVFGVPDFNGAYQVDPLGRVKLPLIDPVMAKGSTTFELEQALESALGESLLQDPDVHVVIETSAGPQLTVDGSVENPGLYPATGQLTLLQAVALSGGPSDGANPRRVIVFRQIEGKRAAAAFDLVAIRNGSAEDPRVYGNDIIVVDGADARRMYGDVLRTLPPLAALFLVI